MQQMDQITQQNAANAEETASASEEMSAQAQNMKEQVGILAVQVGSSVDNGESAYKKQSLRVRAASHSPASKSNGNGATNPESLIPMGENRIEEQNEHMSDF